ncbi:MULTISPECIES: hypothetical protein [Bacillus cereus group]|nr:MULTISPECIES: hypothetical protein [Bacillus cereus group]
MNYASFLFELMLYASLQPERFIVGGWEEQSLSGHNDKHSACPNDL